MPSCIYNQMPYALRLGGSYNTGAIRIINHPSQLGKGDFYIGGLDVSNYIPHWTIL